MDSLAYLFLGSGLCTFAVGLLLPQQAGAPKPVSVRAIKHFLANRRTLWLLFVILLLSIPHRANDSFVGVYIQHLGGTTAMVGQAWFYATASEAVSFALAFYWLRHGKELPLMAIAAAFFALRYMLCASLTEPHWIALLQLFHGVTFAVFYSASIQYLYRTAPDELKATGQTVFACIFFGLSGIISSVLGGWIFGKLGGSVLYQWMAVMSVFSLSLILLTIRKYRSAASRHNGLPH
jgi:PPP family 3-phenylpropionic acid transporter